MLCGTWDLPRAGMKHISTALAGRFLSTVPPGKYVLRKQGQVQRRGRERQTGSGTEPRSLWTSFRKQRGIAEREQYSLGELMFVPRH